MNAKTVLAMVLALGLGGTVFAKPESKEVEPEAVVNPPLPESVLAAASQSLATDLEAEAFPIARNFDNFPTDGTSQKLASPTFKILGAGMFFAAGADLASSEYGLSHSGVYEVNPLQRNRDVRILVHAAAPAFMYFVTDKLRDNGKPRLALLARIGFTIAYSYVTMNNLRIAALAP